MKNIKDLIIASALSIMAASCYAGSLVPNTSTGVSADVSFWTTTSTAYSSGWLDGWAAWQW